MKSRFLLQLAALFLAPPALAAALMPVWQNDSSANTLSFNDGFGHQVVVGSYSPSTGVWTAALGTGLALNQLVLGGGVGAALVPLGSLGTTIQVLHGNAAGAPAFGAIVSADLATVLASPPSIGGVAPGAGAFTTLSASGAITAGGVAVGNGTVNFKGNTSGTAAVVAQAAAGAPTLTLPNATGTFAVSASAPLVLSATTGNLTCPNCSAIISTITTQKFTASGTYTPNPKLAYAVMDCVGAGGGSGGAINSGGTGASSTGGGGGGSYSRVMVTAATVGASQVVTIGAGGTAGASGQNNGGNGGDTSVGALCVGKGGSLSLGAAMGLQTDGGNGGVAGTGDDTFAGNDGWPGMEGTGTVTVLSGAGGRGPFGGGARSKAAISAGAVTINGGPGMSAGSGASGCVNRFAGGACAGAAGSAGYVRILEFNSP